ncbi:alkaline phosphatase synthesis transcriptional regulatory protein PhoP [bacterium BMS3Abin05]|nr:alkaline phosphatase synthesis transcriptional regulatory protein PhoP [bacterium BMS3Abin05]GBE28271.1 alkaline phosphatase synthesis transcriptional regulatory protein PhoP [bacterium BMS3Bbin03]HDL78108.1 response regulator transcription factor [Bacteroidota bacterium]
MSQLIAAVDDEPDILELISLHLKRSGFDVREFLNAADFFKFIRMKTPELIILDLMLPDADGVDICKYLKNNDEYSFIPIIMLTAKAEETDKVLGLELGADDYVTKPFSPRELVARVKAVLRRKKQNEISKRIEIGNVLVIDLQKYEVLVEDQKIELTATEFKILKVLALKKGWVFSREQILSELWGNDKIVLDRTIDVHIKNLREKIGKGGNFIKNIRGVGYKIEE